MKDAKGLSNACLFGTYSLNILVTFPSVESVEIVHAGGQTTMKVAGCGTTTPCDRMNVMLHAAPC